MSRLINGRITLTEDECSILTHQLQNPNEDDLLKRGELLDSIKSMQIKHLDENSVMLTIPDLNIPDLPDRQYVKFEFSYALPATEKKSTITTNTNYSIKYEYSASATYTNPSFIDNDYSCKRKSEELNESIKKSYSSGIAA